jgi:hypothetical protein
MSEYLGYSINRWARAISIRLSDEWDGNTIENKEDVKMLQEVLEESLKMNVEGCKKLIGSSIIEDDYFDSYDNELAFAYGEEWWKK